MKAFVFVATFIIAFAAFAKPAIAQSFRATPVKLRFLKFNPVYVTIFFSFEKTASDVVSLKITANSLAHGGGVNSASAVTTFPGAHLRLQSGRVFLTTNGKRLLIAHDSGRFGGWKMDEGSLKFPKKINYAEESVTVSPVVSAN